jgi:four helix bundle protein
MPFGSYRDLVAWQKAVDLACDVYSLTRNFPADERFGMTAQLRRAALSVSNNIAEGHGRDTRGEFLNSLSASRGSANEVESMLIVAKRLGYASATETQPHLIEVDDCLRLLAGLRSHLKRQKR